MKKKQVALLLAALMCITPVAESAAVMGAEFSSGEETVEMQGTEEEAEVPEEADELKLEVEPEKQPVTEPEEEQRPVQEPVRQPAIPVVPDTIEVPAFDKPEIQPVDTLRKDTVPVVQPAVEDQGMTLKEIQEIRKREAAEQDIYVHFFS